MEFNKNDPFTLLENILNGYLTLSISVRHTHKPQALLVEMSSSLIADTSGASSEVALILLKGTMSGLCSLMKWNAGCDPFPVVSRAADINFSSKISPLFRWGLFCHESYTAPLIHSGNFEIFGKLGDIVWTEARAPNSYHSRTSSGLDPSIIQTLLYFPDVSIMVLLGLNSFAGN
ncbi:UNVERIFIED_CONTAM: hypothetical protein Sangu_0978800 [Sesamum angustifolium]|uniref:Uncharacterized protein n=1 Tax=Sesamum angustifolium TaxID=2727405 RepID=A0AAW2PD00_9LAMI